MWNTQHNKHPNGEKPEVPNELKERPISEGDLIGNFVRRTDNEFEGVQDQNLIGKDIGDDEDEDEKDGDR